MAKDPKQSKIDIEKITNDLTLKIAKEKLDVYTEYQRDALAHFVKQVTDLTNSAPAEEISSVANLMEKWISNHGTIISFNDLDKLLLQIKELPKVDETSPAEEMEAMPFTNAPDDEDSSTGGDMYTGYTADTEDDEEFPTINSDVNQEEDTNDVDLEEDTQDEPSEESPQDGEENSVDSHIDETTSSETSEEPVTQECIQEETPTQAKTDEVEDEEAFSDVELTCVANNSTDESEDMEDFWGDEEGTSEEISTDKAIEPESTANEEHQTPVAEGTIANDTVVKENAEEDTTSSKTIVEQTPSGKDDKVATQEKPLKPKKDKKQEPKNINPVMQAAHYNVKQLHEQFSYVPFAESASIINKAGWILAKNNVSIDELKSCATLDEVVQKVRELFGEDAIVVKPPKKVSEEYLQEKQAAHTLTAQLNALFKHENPTDRRKLVPKLAWKIVKMGKSPEPYLACKSLAELKDMVSKL